MYTKILFIAKSESGFVPTQATSHFIKGQKLTESAYELRIIQLNENGFYLIRFDKHDKELTDTFHESVDEAMEQAKWEYDVESDAWSKFNESL
jgi:hypothetical protein